MKRTLKQTFRSCLMMAVCLMFATTVALAAASPPALGNTNVAVISVVQLDTGQFALANTTFSVGFDQMSPLPATMPPAIGSIAIGRLDQSAATPLTGTGDVALLYARNPAPATAPPNITDSLAAINTMDAGHMKVQVPLKIVIDGINDAQKPN